MQWKALVQPYSSFPAQIIGFAVVRKLYSYGDGYVSNHKANSDITNAV